MSSNLRALAALLITALAMVAGAVPAAAQSPPEGSSEEQAKAPPEEVEGGEEKDDPCLVSEGERGMWLDAVQRGIFTSVCSTARWFDGFFGDQRYDEELESTWGRLAVDTIYDRVDDVDIDVEFRAEVEFPNLDNRFNAFLGRENEDEYVTGRNDGIESLPLFFRDTEDRDWLVGLGYHPARDAASDFDFRVGLKVRFPLEPFVQGRYRKHLLLGETRLVRFRNTAFWRNQHGFGNTVSIDAEQAIGKPRLLRWAGSATFSEITQGVDWRTSLTLYQSLPGPRAMALSAFFDGETDAPVRLERYGLRAIYRRQMLREWFFGQLIAGANWPREQRGEDRETSWELGVGFEIRYGKNR